MRRPRRIGEDDRMRLPRGIAERLGPLQERQFRLLWIGQTASAVGDSLIPVAIAFAVLRLGGSAAGIGLVLAAFTLPRVLLILVGGVWADRLPRQLVMVGSDVVRGTVEVVFAVLLLSGTAQLWHLVLGAAVIGAASAFFVPASSGLIPQTLSSARLQQGNALMSLSRSATGIIGPSVSGLLVATIGPGWVFAVDAATFALSAISLLTLRMPIDPRPREHSGFLAELAGGWREVVSRRWLLAAIVTFGFSNVSQAPIFVLGPVIAQQRLGGAANWGLIVTSLGVGGLLGGLIALRWKPRHPLATGFLLGITFSLPLLALAPPLAVPLIMVAGVLSLASAELTNTWWYTALQQHVPPQALSRVSSYDWLASIIFQPIGFAIAGPVALLIGAPATLIGAAILCLSANLGALTIPAVRQLTWAESGPTKTPPPGERAEGPIAGPIELD
jgi:MFS family permease